MLLFDILKCFRAPLSEEQAWAVCYQSAKELIVLRKESFDVLKRQHIDIKLASIEVCKDGSVSFVTVKKSAVFQEESKVLFDLGSVVYECLDYGMEALVERQLDQELEKLILDMTCEQSDEGISVSDSYDEILSPRERFTTKRQISYSEKDQGTTTEDMTLETVLKRCANHLPKDISDPGGHFRAVCRALVSEALELSAFLHQLCNGHVLVAQTWGRGVGPTNWAFLQSLQAAEWAQLWLQVMRELRQGVSLRHVDHTKLPPVSYELSPYEILLKDIRFKRYTLNHIHITAQVKKDAHDVILEFIRSRPPLTKSSLRKLKQFPKTNPSRHDKLLSEIRSPPKLRSSPRPVVKSAKEIYFEEKIGHSIGEGILFKTPPKRKCLKPEIKLKELIDRWDSVSTVDQSLDELDASPSVSRSSTPLVVICDEEYENNEIMIGNSDENGNVIRKCSCTSQSSVLSLSDEDCVKNRNFSTFELYGIDCSPIFPPSLTNLRTVTITSKVYMTLKEVKHMRRTLALLDLENLDPEDKLYKDLANGRLCFCCRSSKFSLFGKWSRVCEICESKVCFTCIQAIDSSSTYLFREDIDINQRDSGIADISWPFIGYLSLGGDPEERKTHKICSACKRFINMHC